ncbi:MAG: Gfo/Idh/MocA family protein [Candidatus Methylacidiphilales bacterium]
MSTTLSTTTPVRLCMIGAGRHASRLIYSCFPQLKDTEVLANADLDVERARAIARKYGIGHSYACYREMLEQHKPDGVVICVGADFHARAAVELMEQGYHVYTEKAPALDLEQCRKVLQSQRRTGRICMTAFKKRFAPAYAKARVLIAGAPAPGDPARCFGKPDLLTITRTSGNWGGRDDSVNTYLRENSIHVVDLAAYLFGPVRSVAALGRAPATATLALRFANGGLGNISVTDRMSYDRGWEVVTAVGDGGVCIQVDNSVEMNAWKYDQPIAAHKPEFVAGSSHSSVEMGFVGELQAFANAIRAGEQPAEAGIADAVHAMAILQATRLSMQTQQTVQVESNE